MIKDIALKIDLSMFEKSCEQQIEALLLDIKQNYLETACHINEPIHNFISAWAIKTLPQVLLLKSKVDEMYTISGNIQHEGLTFTKRNKKACGMYEFKTHVIDKSPIAGITLIESDDNSFVLGGAFKTKEEESALSKSIKNNLKTNFINLANHKRTAIMKLFKEYKGSKEQNKILANKEKEIDSWLQQLKQNLT